MKEKENIEKFFSCKLLVVFQEPTQVFQFCKKLKIELNSIPIADPPFVVYKKRDIFYLKNLYVFDHLERDGYTTYDRIAFKDFFNFNLKYRKIDV